MAPDRREPRIQWTPEERKRLWLAEKVAAVAAFLIGCAMAYYGFGVAQYAGVGVASIGAWYLFPKAQPLLKAVLDKIPSLGKKAGEPPGEITQQIEALSDEDEAP